MTERMLPNSLEGEKNVIGSCLIDGDAIHRVRAILPSAGMFHQEKHQWIFKASAASGAGCGPLQSDPGRYEGRAAVGHHARPIRGQGRRWVCLVAGLAQVETCLP